VKPLRFTRGSRKHHIGKASARYVIANTVPVPAVHPVYRVPTLTWEGNDERGRELEVVALERPDCWLVTHVMPTHYRKKDQ
jgi:hypothetical protein